MVPWGWDVVSAVAVPGYGDACGAGEPFPVVGEPPGSGQAVPAAEFWPSDLAVFLAEPGRDSFPCVGVDRVEDPFRYTVTEVGRPSPQHSPEIFHEVSRVPVQSVPVGHGPHPVLDGGDRLLRGLGVDEVFVASSFPHPSDIEPEEVESFIDVDHLGLLR